MTAKVRLREIKAMKKKDFKDWKFEELNREFGYKRHYADYKPLEIWLKTDEPVTKSEVDSLQVLAEEFLYNMEAWNDDELKFFLISPLVKLVNLYGKTYKPFTQRKLSAIIDDYEISGVTEFLVSKGIQITKQPYFFFHKYNKDKRRNHDILGQLLAEMIVAQQLNKDSIPIYGFYAVEMMHFFVVLNDKEYSVSDAFNPANKKDILQIFKMFRFVKREIDKHFE